MRTFIARIAFRLNRKFGLNIGPYEARVAIQRQRLADLVGSGDVDQLHPDARQRLSDLVAAGDDSGLTEAARKYLESKGLDPDSQVDGDTIE